MDNSWDNSGRSGPRKKWKYGEPLFTVTLVAAAVLVAGTAGVLWFSRNQATILETERERAKPDWAAAASIIASLQSEGGSKAIYRANPALGARFRSETDFLSFVSQWRPSLDPFPEDVPHPEEKTFGHRHGFGMGPTILSYRTPRGVWVTLHWSAPFNRPSRQLTDLEFHQ